MPNNFKVPSYKVLITAINERNQGSCKNRKKKLYKFASKVCWKHRGYFNVLSSKQQISTTYRLTKTFAKIIFIEKNQRNEDGTKTITRYRDKNFNDFIFIQKFDKDDYLIYSKNRFNFEIFMTYNDKKQRTSYRTSKGIFEEYLKSNECHYHESVNYIRTLDINKYNFLGVNYNRDESLEYLTTIMKNTPEFEDTHKQAKFIYNLIYNHVPMKVEGYV